MGSEYPRFRTGFYAGVVVDATTLPRCAAGDRFEEGDRFIVKGNNFDVWPGEIVLSSSDNLVISQPLPQGVIMRLVERTKTELVFEQTIGVTYGIEHVWQYFAAPYDPPRSLLVYRLV